MMYNFRVTLSTISVLVLQCTIATATQCSPCGGLSGLSSVSLPSLPSLNLNLVSSSKCDDQPDCNQPAYSPSYLPQPCPQPCCPPPPSISVRPLPQSPPINIPPPPCASGCVTSPSIILAVIPSSQSKCRSPKRPPYNLLPPPPPSCNSAPITVPLPVSQPFAVPTYDSGCDECC